MLDRTRHFDTPRHHAMHVPRTMFAAVIDRFGGPEVITPHALPVPAVDAGEVLIAVDTAGVGRWDADIREGYFASRKPHFPTVLGVDGAGVVAALGARVRRLKVGEEVYSYNWQNPKRLLRGICRGARRQGRADPQAVGSAACRRDPYHGLDRATGH